MSFYLGRSFANGEIINVLQGPDRHGHRPQAAGLEAPSRSSK